MPRQMEPPGAPGRPPDADARPCQHRPPLANGAGGRHPERPCDEVESRVAQVDPERGPDTARAAGQRVIRRPRSARTHRTEPEQRLERSNQDGRCLSVGFADEIETVVHAVGQIDVRRRRRTEHHRRARRAPPVGMACRITEPAIGLDLDDATRHARTTPIVDEHATEQVLRDVEDVACKETPAEPPLDECLGGTLRHHRFSQWAAAGSPTPSFRNGSMNRLRISSRRSGVRASKRTTSAG